MPIYMRLGKLRGPHMKKSMPIGPFRTYAVPVNVGRLAAKFSAGDEVTPQALVDKGIVKNTRTPIKILGGGDLDDRAHRQDARLLGERAGEDQVGRRRGRAPLGADERELMR